MGAERNGCSPSSLLRRATTRGFPLRSPRAPLGTRPTTLLLASVACTRLLVCPLLRVLTCCAINNSIFIAQFITSCPSTNPTLPVTPLAKITLSSATPAPGSTVAVSVDGKSTDSAFVAYFSGLQVLYSKIDGGKTVVPAALQNAGTVYVAVSSVGTGVPTDTQMLSGLGIMEFAFVSATSQ